MAELQPHQHAAMELNWFVAGKDFLRFTVFPRVWNKHIHITQTTVTNDSSQIVKQTNPLLHTHRHKSNTQTSSHILPPSVSSTESARKHVWTISALCSACFTPPTCKLLRTVCLSVLCIHIHSLCRHKCTSACTLVPVLSVAVSWAWRAIWSPLPCHVPCEVLSAWPLWSPVATEGLQHSTSSPGSRPQKRKFGSFKCRGCSWAIYRTLYWSSATHDIPYEK